MISFSGHCAAIGCTYRCAPRELMCKPHWNLVNVVHMAKLVAPDNAWEQLEAYNAAVLDVACREGKARRFPPISLSSPDASQANTNPPASPSAAGMKEIKP